MDFLQKLDFLMEKYGLNKNSMSQNSGIPYTTIDGWYKKGYDGLKLSTFKKLAEYFNTTLDFWIKDDITDPNYGKAFGFGVDFPEMEHIKKYRSLDDYGKEAVDGVLDVEYRRCEADRQADRAAALREQRQQLEAGEMLEPEKVIRFRVPEYTMPMSAGTGAESMQEFPQDRELIAPPPRGTSYIAHVSGNSMEPTYHNGDMVFVHACEEIPVGRIGVFLMDGKQWIKERGDGVLISHNSEYDPIPMRDDIKCQGWVLGICDESYFE